MRRLGSTLVALSMLLWGCSSSTSGGSDALTRTVLVDYNHDEYAASFMAYFPQVVEVRQGDTINFKQAWTGEGHSVTMGTMVDAAVKPVRVLIKSGNVPDEPPPEIVEKLKPLPEMLSGDIGMVQSAARPCYLDTGAPPLDELTPCPKVPQPEFNGRQTYYSSGLIPYEGTGGNTYRVKLSNDIAPGTYTYYCNLHGPLQSGEIVVKPKGAKVPSQSAVDKQGRAELQKLAKPALNAFKDAKKGKAEVEGEPLTGNLAGYFAPDPDIFVFIDEFLPRTIRARVGEKVTWTVLGPHTVSFNVPPYLPQFNIGADGTVTYNPQAYDPVASPAPPPYDENRPPNTPLAAMDAGRWDGSYFISSGLIGEVTYSLTFTKAGRYKYACLVHPRMVGEVVVS